MNRKIVFCCLFTVVLLLIIPSISAIQNNAIKLEINTDSDAIITLQKDLQDKGISIKIDDMKLPLLFKFVLSIYYFKSLRGTIWYALAYLGTSGYNPEPRFPLMEVRSLLLFFIADSWWYNWLKIAENNGWNWED